MDVENFLGSVEDMEAILADTEPRPVDRSAKPKKTTGYSSGTRPLYKRRGAGPKMNISGKSIEEILEEAIQRIAEEKKRVIERISEGIPQEEEFEPYLPMILNKYIFPKHIDSIKIIEKHIPYKNKYILPRL